MDKSRFIKSGQSILLIFILFIAFLLYIKQFLPFESVDETMIAGFVWDLHRTPFPVNLYPPFFLYIHFLLSLAYKSILMFLGAVESHAHFLSTIGLSVTVETARVINALLATALVYLVFRMGKKFYNPSVAFFAALVMAFNPLVVLHAHIFKSDILVSLLITLSLFLLFKHIHTPRRTFIYFSAYLYGLAVAAKYNVFVFAPVILLALLMTRKEIRTRRMIRTAVLLPLVMAAGFFTGAPNWLVHPLGNIRLFLEKYGFGSHSVFEPYRLYSPLQTYLEFLTTWISDFGWVFVLILIIAIPVALLTRGKKATLLAAFILIYVILFGFTGFYGDRFSLPLYSGMALLVGKTLFVDLKSRWLAWKKPWTPVAVIIWLGTALFLISAIQANLSTFNLLKTKSKSKWASDYREQHHLVPQRFHIAFQHMTPRIRGGIKLNGSLKLRFYQRHHHLTPDFIQLVHDRYREFMKTYDRSKSRLTIDFSAFRPFHLIRKPKIQPWDNDFIFLYRISRGLSAVDPPPALTGTPLPRCFTMNPHTSYFPLQPYEKNPGFGKTHQGRYHHYLYSREKIPGLKILLFNPLKRYDLTLRVNNRTRRFRKKNAPAVVPLELSELTPKKRFPDHVYQMEIKKNTGLEPCYFVFWPRGSGPGEQKSVIVDPAGPPIREPIPPLFSQNDPPPWQKDFYGKTGIDLSLLSFINTVELYRNTGQTPGDVKIDCVPLEPGIYTLSVTGESIMDAPPGSKTQRLTCRLYSIRGVEKIQSVLKYGTTDISLEIRGTPHFLQLTVKDMVPNNYLLREITVRPDYLGWIKKQRESRSQIP